MKIDNLKDVMIAASENEDVYITLTENLYYLRNERIKLITNDMKAMLNRPLKEINKEKMIESVKQINKIATELGCDFYIDPEWKTIEVFLRLSILQDLEKEFEKQKK